MITVVVIPAYRPSERLIELVRALAGRTLIVVDDGSGAAYARVFSRIAQLPDVHLLSHAANQGKGAALKTAMRYALATFPDLIGIVTADADGQHDPEDIARIASRLTADPEALVLGARQFGRAVPLRSRIGNVVTRRVVQLLAGQKLTDTQTGLRGIPARLLPDLVRIDAQGYDFELEMLLAARRLEVRVVEEPIRTIYEPGNLSSHFNPLLDSMKIYFVLLRFSSVSLATALLDNLAFILVYRHTGALLESQFIGRLIGVTFNYLMVRKTVFGSHQRHRAVLPRYLTLSVVSGAASFGGIELLAPVLNVYAAKLLVETLLFLVNFTAQRLLIFRPAHADDEARHPAATRFFSWLVLGVYAAVVCTEVYGTIANRLFFQEVWSPVGLARFTRFTGLFLALATPVMILAPWGFAALAAAVAVVFTAAAVGIAPVLALAFFLISACALGSRLLGEEEDLLAVLLGTSLYIFPMPWLARLPVNYVWVYAVALSVPVALDLRGTWRRLARWMTLPGRLSLQSWSERSALALLVFVLAMQWLIVLKPEASADALSMHLAVPANIAANHVMTYQPSRFVWAVMPMGADFAYSTVYLFGGEFAARLLNFAWLLMIEGLLYCAARRWLARPASFLILALFAASPIVLFVTGSLFVENLLAALVLGAMMALWYFGETGAARFLYAAAWLFGSAMATKVGAAAFIAVALPLAAVEVRRRWKAGVLAAVLLLFAAAPPYAIAWWKTGNPLFPFHDPKIRIQDTRFRQPLTLQSPYDLTFHTNQWYEGQNGSFGFQYLLLAPLGMLALLVVAIRPSAGAAVVALGASIIILKSEPNARYLYAALPLLCIPFANLLGWLYANQRRIYRTLIAYVVACIVLNAYFLPASSYYHKDFYGGNEQIVPFRQAIAYFNRAHPRAPVLLTEDSFHAGLTGEVYENHWHQSNVMQQIFRAKDIPQLRSLLAQWKVQYFIARLPKPHHNLRPPALRELLERCTQLESGFGDYYVARLQPVCRPPEVVPLPLARPGTYDDFDAPVRFRGDWIQTDDFTGPYHHTISYSDDPDAEVELAFEGTSLTCVLTKAPNRGLAEIVIDGVSKAKPDLYSPAVQWQSRVEFTGLGSGRHTVVVRVLGQKRPESQGTFVDLDAFEVK